MKTRVLLTVVVGFLCVLKGFAQDTFVDTLNCQDGTPTYIVDLTSNADSLWKSNNTDRSGECCGGADKDCVQFAVNLSGDVVAIKLDIPEDGNCGAKPTGSLFYQVDCGPLTSIAEVVCVGPGEHVVTFCKPGANKNCFSIQSISEPNVSPAVSINDGCSGKLGSTGYDISTISWKSVAPGLTGDYNSYLDCVSACDTVNVNAQPGFPEFVDFEVCGLPIGGCQATEVCQTVRAYFNSTLQVDILPQNPTVCFGDAGTIITANPTGGTSPYVYLWNTGETTKTIFVDVGGYSVQLSDTTGCPPTNNSITVTEFLNPIVANAGGNITVCSDENQISLSGSVLSASGGVWKGGDGVFLPNENDLNAVYQPTQSEKDFGFINLSLITTGNGSCPADTDTVSISFVTFNSIMDVTVSDVSCFGGADGNINLSSSSLASPYTYLWEDGSSVASKDLLVEGNYQVTVTDRYSCDAIYNYSLTEPTILTISAVNTTDVSCYDGDDGTADISVQGGVTPYSYNWNNGFTTNNSSALTAGVYDVTITDLNECSDQITFTITEPSLMAITVSNVNSTCGDSNGSLTAFVEGGVSTYGYLWSNGATFDNISGLGSAFYSVTVTDQNSCQIIGGAGISDPVPITSITDYNDVSCFGGSDGMAHVTSKLGTTPYSFNWSNGATDSTATGLSAGLYIVTISDAVQCKSVEQIIISEPQVLAINFNTTNVSCFGLSDGFSEANADGGSTPYSYNWSNNIIGELSTGMSIGVYQVTVTDAKNCKFNSGITITEPLQLSLDSVVNNVSCKGGEDGYAEVSVSGGVMPYLYQWESGSTIYNEVSLNAGDYLITVFDANDCEETLLISVSEPQFAINLNTVNTDVDCFGENTATATVLPSGGVSPYIYVWDNASGSQGSQTASGLEAGAYSVTVFDVNNCDQNNIGYITITQPEKGLTINLSVSDVLCNGNSDGLIESLIEGGTPGYLYSWSNGLSIPDIDNLSPGSYGLTVTDANGCQESNTISVGEPLALSLTGVSTSVTCYGLSDGVADITVNGGLSPYVFYWNDGYTIDNKRTDLLAGNYEIQVTDNNQCQEVITVDVGTPDTLAATSNINKPSCVGEMDGSVDLEVTGGVSPYTYQWGATAGFQNNSTATSLSSGTYNVEITDVKDCQFNFVVTIEDPAIITIMTTPNADTICPGETSLLGVLANGGNGNFTFNWSDDLGAGQTKIVSADSTHIYFVTATDQLGCVSIPAAVTVNVVNFKFDDLNLIQNGPVCEGDSIILGSEFEEEYPPYVFNWSDGLGSSLGEISILPMSSQTYFFSVTDQCNNMLVKSIDVVVNLLPNAEVVPSVDIGCVPLEVEFVNGIDSVSIVSYFWEFGDGLSSSTQFPSHSYEEEGNYEVKLTVVSEDGCVNVTSPPYQITVYPKPEAIMKITPQFTDIENAEVTCISLSIGSDSQLWSFGDGDSSVVQNIAHTYRDTGRYLITLVVENEFGCVDTSYEWVQIGPVYKLEVPNAIVPNLNGGNGGSYNKDTPSNQVFFPFTDYVRDYHLMIFNRWGELIFESFDLKIGWDGYYRGQLCQQDLYVWKINLTYEDGKQESKVGEVHLIR